MTTATKEMRNARDFLLANRENYQVAYDEFVWPRPDQFNFALDWFDAELCVEHPDRTALRIIEVDGTDSSYSYAQLSSRSNQLANWMRSLGIGRGTRVLVLLGNQVELWETFLAAMKLGAVLIPATTMLLPIDVLDRMERAAASAVIARSDVTDRFSDVAGPFVRIAVGETIEGWHNYKGMDASPTSFEADGPTLASDPLLIYFTSGTTSKPKIVEHTQVSYPIGHLSTMFWIGLQPGDVHLNVSSPGWAKHAWSCVFAPWIAGATICLFNYDRFDAPSLLDVLRDAKVTSFCAPPTVWRTLVQQDLAKWTLSLREVLSAGEPLNPEVIDHVQREWGLHIRDGYGQTETTLMIGNSPGQVFMAGSMGRPLPGFRIDLIDPLSDKVGNDGEICVCSEPERPVGLMVGYQTGTGSSSEINERVFAGGRYHTGDVAVRDADGFITFVGRTDDVFKSSDYRISPFELESVLIEFPAVAEAAVVPAPDEKRLSVPKAYVTLVAGSQSSPELAGEILAYCRENLAPYKRIRRLEFAELPKTISGKIRRVELRNAEMDRGDVRRDGEYREEDFA